MLTRLSRALRLQSTEGGEASVTVFVVLTQIVMLLRALQPLLAQIATWAFHAMKPCSRKAYTAESRHIKNCKVRNAAYAATDKIVRSIQHQPNGYTFWAALPPKGAHNAASLRKTVTDIIITSLFPATFLAVLLQSALTEDGRPLPKSPLYRWLVENVYSGKAQRLYADWLLLRDREHADAY